MRDTAICARTEDKAILVADYPLLPVRRRFWEHTLRTVDRRGTAGQLRTQLRIVYDAILHTADEPLGTVVAADFLFDELEGNLLQSGVLLREIYETIVTLREDGTADGLLKSRLCALVFLIRKLPREAGADIGVRATTEALTDLMVRDLAQDGAALRARLPELLEELVAAGTLMKLDNEYGLQTRESSEWEAEFRNRQNRLNSDLASMSSKRAQLLGEAVQAAVGRMRLVHGDCKEPRRLALDFGADEPPSGDRDIRLWVRHGWGTEESTALADARAAGPDSPTIHVFIPKSRADALARLIATLDAATETLEYKGVPATDEGKEARQGMETRQADAENNLRALVGQIIDRAKVFQGGGNERLESALPKRVEAAANASLVRLFYQFDDADDSPLEPSDRACPRRSRTPVGGGGSPGQDGGAPGVRGRADLGRCRQAAGARCAPASRIRRLAGRVTPSTARSSACLKPGICVPPPTAWRCRHGHSTNRRCQAPTFASKLPPSAPASACRCASCFRPPASGASGMKR